jgi:hypothetical protein
MRPHCKIISLFGTHRIEADSLSEQRTATSKKEPTGTMWNVKFSICLIFVAALFVQNRNASESPIMFRRDIGLSFNVCFELVRNDLIRFIRHNSCRFELNMLPSCAHQVQCTMLKFNISCRLRIELQFLFQNSKIFFDSVDKTSAMMRTVRACKRIS